MAELEVGQEAIVVQLEKTNFKMEARQVSISSACKTIAKAQAIFEVS